MQRKVAWRCKNCRVISFMDAGGGLLLCGCSDQPSGDWEFQVMYQPEDAEYSIWVDPPSISPLFN